MKIEEGIRRSKFFFEDFRNRIGSSRNPGIYLNICEGDIGITNTKFIEAKLNCSRIHNQIVNLVLLKFSSKI